ncbi:NB-ARC domain-containing protein [Plectonema radiosum]|uniref:NB-ARC domain-containing protein n=1 Tax=Plectonema radiosum TaxID=945768 RepID=UPI002AD5A131|nr:NB-ARC domain-containing protein [Plectonema radiosum]
MRPDENSRKPQQTNQSIIDDAQVGRDVNIETVNQSITINNSSNANTLRLKVFQAPPTPEYYVDRPEISRDLKQRLLADGGTLVISAIHGLGSVGKSTLAAALAHDADIQKHFCDGILWATLSQEPDVLSLLGGWVQGLGDYNYRATSIEATSAHLNTLLFDKAVLLVVDDAWIDEILGWEPVQAFKVGGDRTRMLVTTRDASIANFLGANTFSLDVMTETQALKLLTKKLDKQGKQLQEDEIKSAQALAKAVGYLPLALELAAAQVASGTSWQILIQDIRHLRKQPKSYHKCLLDCDRPIAKIANLYTRIGIRYGSY